MAGFGDYAKEKVRNMEESGMYLVNRRHQNFDEAAEQLADYMFDFVKKNRRERIALRNKVESNSHGFSWDTLGRYYIEAYRMAVEKYNKEVDHNGLSTKFQKEKFKAELYTFIKEQISFLSCMFLRF